VNHVHEVIKVIAFFDPEMTGIAKGMTPIEFKWKNREYKVSEVTLHYTRLIEGIINHVFCIIAGGSSMELHFNTKNLLWTVEGIKDSEESA